VALDYAYELEPEREAYTVGGAAHRYERGPALWSVMNRAKLAGALDRSGALTDEILRELRNSKTDFRTVDSLAQALGQSSSQVRLAVEKLLKEDTVRRPYGAKPEYAEWIRLTSAGPTTRERWRWYRAMAGRTGIDE